MATTTFYDFTPSANTAYVFEPVLDGSTYTGIVTWNVYAQRFYLNLYTLQGILVLALPMVGSPAGYDISLTAGYFTSKIVYRVPNRQIEVIT